MLLHLSYNPNGFPSDRLFHCPILLSLLLTLLDLLDQESSFDSIESEERHHSQCKSKATACDGDIGPAHLEAHVLVGAQPSAAVESDHQVSQEEEGDIEHDLKPVKRATGVWSVDAHDVDHDCCGEEQIAQLEDPILV